MFIETTIVKRSAYVVSIASALVLAITAGAQDQLPSKGAVTTQLSEPQYSPYAGRNFPTQVFWGDTHLHTQVSVDAGTMTRLSQEDAFRFARGEQVTTTHGLEAKLSRPLDFIVISDHAEMYGLMPQLLAGDQEILSTEYGGRWYKNLTAGDPDLAFDTAMEIIASLSGDVPLIKNDKAIKNAWYEYAELADRYN